MLATGKISYQRAVSQDKLKITVLHIHKENEINNVECSSLDRII